ncbi:MAG TPA: TrkA family potassium uptake protein [Tepidisphaeraceae bacterium]|jgi:trk system potassium uptake protein TrkA|nr:TrkA family potassium uptake protein [Tepidisphaeraceae bacterium]
MKRFVIIGLGNFGGSVAESLHARGHEVVVVDTNPNAVDRIAVHVTRAAVGDGRSLQVLERIGAKGADAGVVSTGDDIAASILSTMALKDLGVSDVYVKVISQDHARVMERIGVTETIFPERESALGLGTRMSGKALFSYTSLLPGFGVQEMAVPESWQGKTLRDLTLRQNFRVSIIAVHDVMTDQILPVPDPDAALQDSDTLLVAGTEEDLSKLAQET